MQTLARYVSRIGLVGQIVIGIVSGIVLALLAPVAASSVGMLRELFIAALKAAAPVLVLVLVMASIAGHKRGQQTYVRPILVLYLIGTFCAAAVAVIASFVFPTTLALIAPPVVSVTPGGISSVLKNLLLSAVANPVQALSDANFIGILAWAVALGTAFRHAAETTRAVLDNLCAAVSRLVALVFTCLRESAITAFSTRSSAANIPVNMELCSRLKLHEDTYSISIPLGATIGQHSSSAG